MKSTIACVITNRTYNACDVECNELARYKRDVMEAYMELYFHKEFNHHAKNYDPFVPFSSVSNLIANGDG